MRRLLHNSIDTKLGIVFTVGSGALTDDDIRAHQQSLAKNPDFRPNLRQLLDTRAVTEVKVTPEGVRAAVAGNPFGKGAKRAFVAATETIFGMARMFEQSRVNPQDEFRVFRSMDEARAWLGLPKEGTAT